MIRGLPFLMLAAVLTAIPSPCQAQLDFERPPISYSTHPSSDPVARLQEDLEAGRTTLEYDKNHGYLPAVLKALKIPASSQMLVFSKTSLQLHKISPRRPRALYFNDDTYVGWVQGGDVLEIASVDPELGSVFYTIAQDGDQTAKILRDQGQCLTCHASSRTLGVPGLLVRSVFTDPSGRPHFGSGTFTTTAASPFDERWGGWYVTGEHGEMRHMGNVVSPDTKEPESINRNAGANVTDLSSRFNTARYLEPSSDIAALMVLEHQVEMHNLYTLANYEARMALHYNEVMNKALGRPEGECSESTERRIAAAGEKLVRGLLLLDEFPLSSPVVGNSSFSEEFVNEGPRDSEGRSLRELDLKTRLFKYPCSFLITAPSYDALPERMRTYVTQRLLDILEGRAESEGTERLSAEDRLAILEILRDVKPNLFPQDEESETSPQDADSSSAISRQP